MCVAIRIITPVGNITLIVLQSISTFSLDMTKFFSFSALDSFRPVSTILLIFCHQICSSSESCCLSYFVRLELNFSLDLHSSGLHSSQLFQSSWQVKLLVLSSLDLPLSHENFCFQGHTLDLIFWLILFEIHLEGFQGSH